MAFPIGCRTGWGWRKAGRNPSGGHHISEQRGDFLAQFGVGHDGIDQPVIEHELRGLEAGRQILVGGFLDHAPAGEADHAARFGKIDIPDGGERGGDAAGGRVGEHRDVGKARFGEPREGAAGFGHLHQG